ncbi:amidase family protein [Holospora curviuscula]|uniref:Glutamyl-tRNA(Gln) amidotransferase subunit A n=1 Tax=Holospora curviuscula TaxID=1082868 RepID=A0A2S5R8M0_9PROT|nr:amidase family protein [Holospora curviuscula]PPE03689.1 Glutamyl-tRNA(Gln) amidotransferase subunit A [Holospora curviuscula]
MPTTSTPAFPLAQATKDPVTIYRNDILTVPENIENVFGISIPCGFSETRLPLEIQILAPAFEDVRLFQVR